MVKITALLAFLLLSASGVLLNASGVPAAPVNADAPATSASMPASTAATAFRWMSTGPLIHAVADPSHKIVSVKDPTVVYFHGRWHVYATTADTNGGWNMAYFSFTDWSQAASAKPYYMDQNPNLVGYHCAPQLFYFRPQRKWYLLYQSGQPQYSTADDPGKPETWSKPQDFLSVQPAIVHGGWLDYWIICDDKSAHLFFSGDDGRWYRSQTSLQDFPKGFGAPVIVMQAPNPGGLFEASCVYKVKGTARYLALIEAIGPSGRFYKSFTADRLDGQWTPLAATWEDPFAGTNNVAFPKGGPRWTNDISHGEMLRSNYDQTPTVDPAHLELLYQGLAPGNSGKQYSQLPYQLGLLREQNPVSLGL